MSADVFVRPAGPDDAAAVAAVQRRVWDEGYRPLLPPAALEVFAATDVEGGWRQAITEPPSPRHHVLVAVSGDAVVGAAACGPTADTDRDPDRTGELVLLAVAPDHRRAGHGSRLLNAVVDVLRSDGVTEAVTWVLDADGATTAFLEAAGWAADGSRRDLDTAGGLVPQHRLHTAL